MGEINKYNVDIVIKECSAKLKYFKNKLYSKENLTESELITILILLGQYLYAYYCDHGELCGDVYIMYPNTVEKAIKNERYAKYAYQLILLRNLVCHEYGTPRMKSNFNKAFKYKDKLLDFLEYLLDYSKTLSLMNAINAMEGK